MENMCLSSEPKWIKILLILITVCFLFILVLLPLIIIFVEAFDQGLQMYLTTFHDENTLHAIKLTIIVACIVLPLNTLFGIIASWSITKFEFVGKKLLITLIDLPLSVSPVIAGLIYVLLFNPNTLLGQWMITNNIRILFAIPGLVLVTLFVTFPYVARELISLMQGQNIEEEEAAILLGANTWQTFWKVTLPNIKWGLLYGILLCNARAMGEFGAVTVISGHIRGKTETIPLYVATLYEEFNTTAAFALASILTLLALFTLLLSIIIEKKYSFSNNP